MHDTLYIHWNKSYNAKKEYAIRSIRLGIEFYGINTVGKRYYGSNPWGSGLHDTCT